VADRSLDGRVAEQFMGWGRMAAPADFDGKNGGNEILIPPDFKQWIRDGYTFPPKGALSFAFLVPEWSRSVEQAWPLVMTMTARGVEVIIGTFPARPGSDQFCIELRRWRDRRDEGSPGDPHTGRSRETFALLHGDELPALICEAALRVAEVCR
jgi:hypothetical protein